jgi:hypothetical protein
MEVLRDRVENLSLEALSPIVRQVLDDDQLLVLDREVSEFALTATNPTTRGLFRIGGTARKRDGETVSWLVVLKVIGDVDLIDTGYSHEPRDWNYWKREALAFRSGLLDDSTGPLWPVRSYAVEEVTADEVWIWLQACGDIHASPHWTLDDLASAAHDLGAFAAQWASAPPSPERYPWLACRWVNGWVATSRLLGVDHATGHDGCWASPLLRDLIPRTTQLRAANLMAQAEPLQNKLAQLPVTLAHHDAQASNTFQAEECGLEHGTVMIDWSFLGLAPVGTDLGLHVAQSLTGGAVNPTQAADFDRMATEAYLMGVRVYGGGGPSEAILFARAASAALVGVSWLTAQAAWLCPEMRAVVGDDMSTWPESAALQQNTDVENVLAGWAATFEFLLGLGDEAMQRSENAAV